MLAVARPVPRDAIGAHEHCANRREAGATGQRVEDAQCFDQPRHPPIRLGCPSRRIGNAIKTQQYVESVELCREYRHARQVKLKFDGAIAERAGNHVDAEVTAGERDRDMLAAIRIGGDHGVATDDAKIEESAFCTGGHGRHRENRGIDRRRPDQPGVGK
nr:hypothetical protein [Sphingobium estronivorans]